MRNLPMELLAPAGDEAALKAAVQNGADAVYLGAGAFNARRNAGNFDGDALDAAVRYCHARGVKVHVTLNTLVRQDEFDALCDAVRAINRSGADAVIVQDFGVVRAIRQIAPGIQLHASTQMAVHNRQGVAFLKSQGFDRAVLARELTFEEIAECAGEGIEIETFAHGALCVACSGQCLMSSLVGGRSGNRGLCAQPCRLPWRLEDREGYLLSTRDLCAIDSLDRLRDAGVTSLKIEGRLKRAEYVAVTVAAYRRALDALFEGRELDPEAERAQLKQMFNRGGFTRGYGPGVTESDLMYPARPNHIGVPVGRCRRDGEITLDAGVESADALALRRDGAEDAPVKLSGGAGERVSCPKARRGDALVRLVSEEQMRAARQSFEGERRQVPVTAKATLKVGERAALTVSDGVHTARAFGGIVEAATGRPLDADRVRAQLGKTGGTPYALTGIEIEADAGAFCPASMLNALRRDALAALEDARTAVDRPERDWEAPSQALRASSPPHEGEPSPDGVSLPRCEGEPSPDGVSLPRCEGEGSPDGVSLPRCEGEPSSDSVSLPRCEGEGSPYGVSLPRCEGEESPYGVSLPRCEGEESPDGVSLPRPREGERCPKGGEGVPLLLAQSDDPAQLQAALEAGADRAVLMPSDVRPEALARLDLAPFGDKLMLALPAVLTAEALDGLNAWALENRDRFQATFLSNIGQLALEWPGRRVGDFMLNHASDAAAAQLAEWGIEAFTPSVELNAGQIGALGGEKDLILWGRVPLMHLRHCPLRAERGMKGRHADCHHCDSCPAGDRLDGKALTDRRGAAFPLKRLAMPGGCVVQVLNSVPLMPLRRLDRLPRAGAWRLLLNGGEPAAEIVRVYRAALDGRDFRALPEWAILDGMDTTTGHYFRGVE